MLYSILEKIYFFKKVFFGCNNIQYLYRIVVIIKYFVIWFKYFF